MYEFLAFCSKKNYNKDMLRRNIIISIAKNTLIVLFSLFILLAASVSFIKNKYSYSLIENNLSDFLGLKIELINPKTTFDTHFSIVSKINTINIYNYNKTKKFISIENLDVNFKPLDLLFNKANFKSLSAEKITLNIKRDKEGKIDFYESVKKRDFSKFKNDKLKITRLESRIESLDLNFIDEFTTNANFRILVNNSDIYISKKYKTLSINQTGLIETTLNNQKQTSNLIVNIQSRYPFNSFSSDDLDLDINLSNFNLYILSDAFRNYVSKDADSLKGCLDLKIKTNNDSNIHNQELIADVSNLGIVLKDKKLIVPYKEKISAKMLFGAHKDALSISSFKLASNNLLLNASGKIIKPLSKNPSLELETEISNTQLNNFLYLLPDNLIYYRPGGISALKKADFYAMLEGKINLKYSPLNVTGNLKASNVHIPSAPKPFRQNDVNVVFMKDKMRLYTRVYTPDDQYVTIDGISNLDDSLYGKYSVKSTPKINLAYAQIYLVPIQQIIGFNLGPLPIMKVAGYGNIDIKTQGTIEDAQIFGNFKAYDASAQMEGLDAKLTKGKCELIFDNRNLIFREIKGKIGTADFLLTGNGNTKGDVNLNNKINNITTSELVNILNNSSIGAPYKKVTKNIAALSGLAEVDINLKGTIKNYEDKNFINDLFPSGAIKLKNNKVVLNNKLGVSKINAILNFGKTQKGIVEFFVNNSQFNLDFYSKDSLDKIIDNKEFVLKTNVFSNRIAFNDLIKELRKYSALNKKEELFLSYLSNFNFYSKISLKSEFSTTLDKVNFATMKNDGYIEGINSENNKNIKFNSGIIRIVDNRLIFDNFNVGFYQGYFKIKGIVNNFLTHPLGDLTINLDNINLDKINTIIPTVNPVSSGLKTGKIVFRNDSIKLEGFSFNYNTMPVYLNAKVKNLYSAKILEADFSTILNETTADNIINPYLTYPVKIKGEVPLKGTFKGNSDDYSISFHTDIPIESDIQFGGANINDGIFRRQIEGRIDVKGNIATIDNLKLIKFIKNQNNRINPIDALKVSGRVIQKQGDIYYDNFKVATQVPINVRMLNLVFKKSLLKQGNFECSLNINGNLKNPRVVGKAELSDLDIPLYDTQINNIKVNLTNSYIDGEIFAKNKRSDLKVLIKAINRLIPPYTIEKVGINSNNLNINDIIMSLPDSKVKSDIETKQPIQIKPNDVIIKDGFFKFNEVEWDKIKAQNLNGYFNYKNEIFNFKNSSVDIAKGRISAGGKYNPALTKLEINADMDNCDANLLSTEFLNLPNHIFGKMNGSINLSAKGLNTPDGIKNINSKVNFSINNGKMPKLGSLEYLLRAGNLIKNGIVGFSLNNLIQILTPYKTGEFEQIKGSFALEKGEVNNLEIFSKGKNLSLYLNGSYSILDNLADIQIYGKLSQSISNALGAIGNASIRQFIDAISAKKDKNIKDEQLAKNLAKIPSIEIENPSPRYFRVKVLGDINKENYIKSFRWE